MFDLLAQLLSDLNWLAVCSLNWDPNSLLGAYKKYRYVIPDQVSIFSLSPSHLFLLVHFSCQRTTIISQWSFRCAGWTRIDSSRCYSTCSQHAVFRGTFKTSKRSC